VAQEADGNLLLAIQGAVVRVVSHNEPQIILSGDDQTNGAFTPYAQPLGVTVTDASNHPISGLVVTYTAPASGPSAMFAGSSTAVTDANGHASVSVISNGVIGAFIVSASVPGFATPVSFHLNIQSGPLTLEGAFIFNLYQFVLFRPLSRSEYDRWIGFLSAGGSRSLVAKEVWESAEHRGVQVGGYYVTYLHRLPGPGERDGWVAAMVAGLTETQVIEAIIASPEYQAAHASNADFIDSLYSNIFRRTDGSTERAQWLQFLEQGGSRDQMARLFLNSTEAALQVVITDYGFLGRLPEIGGQAWVNALASGAVTRDGLAEFFLASDEFFMNG
jgi:hypothetical protein